MASVDIRKADRILQELLDLEQSERADFLEASCGDDEALKKLVRRLLIRTTGGGDSLAPGAALRMVGVETSDFARRPASLLEPGDRVDKFRIVRELGRGGMATVYLAERSDGTFEQTVALKVLDRSGESVARFEQERQILATFDNPNIARVISGGVTGTGSPYVAMEYVEGMPILEYCDANCLDVDERLRLFVPIVEAVHVAHRNLVVHRDIKSSNILVTAAGVPKLLDFGIAKLLASDALPHAAPETRAAVPFTPEYASPEQIQGKLMSVSTDIYQLGYLLYLMLVGRSPYPGESSSVAALVEAIVNSEPILPSVRARQLERAGRDGDSAGSILANRRTSAARLQRRLDGDLDRVVMKALHKDPDHRYVSASQFAADIGNVLDNRPLIARPDSVMYRTRKFVRRHRIGVAATAVATAVAVALTTAFTLRLAQENERALQEAAKAREVSEFLIELVALTEPERARGRDITVREVLDRAANRIDYELSGQPETQATLQSVMGQMYRELGAYEQAESLLDTALRSREALAGSNHPDVADVLMQRTELYLYQGRYEEAVDASDRILSLVGDDDSESNRVMAGALRLRGRALRMNGELDAARETLAQAQSLRAYADPLNARLAASIDVELGNVEYDASNFTVARESLLRAIELLQSDGSPPNLDLARANLRLSFIAVELGDLEEAERRARASLDIVQGIHKTTHPDMQYPLGVLSSIHVDRREFATAERLLEQQLNISREFLGEEHPETATVLNNFGTLMFRQDRYDDAAEYYRQSVDIRKSALGPEHPITGMTMSFEAYARYLAGDPEAEQRYMAALSVLEAAYEPGHRYIANVHHDLGRLYVEQERYADAEGYLQSALVARTDVYGAENVRVAATRLYLGACLSGLGRLDEARPLLDEARKWTLDRHGEESLEVAHVDLWMADWLRRAGRADEARDVYGSAVSRIQNQRPDDHWLSRLAARLADRM